MNYLITNREIGAFNFMLILENVSLSKKYFNRLLKISKAVLIVAFFVIIIQQIHNENFFVRPDLVSEGFSKEIGAEDRIDSIYSWLGSNSSGYGFIPIFIIIAEVLARKKKSLLIWIIFGLIFAMLARARWLMINALLVFFILIINHKDKVRRVFKYSILVPVIAVGTYITLNNVGINAKDIVENRILEINDKGSQKSSSTRILAFVIFNKLYWKNAVFGKGNEKYGMGSTKPRHNYELETLLAGRSSQIHVGYLMLFYMYGLVGGIPFLIFIFLITKRLYKDAKITTYWGPFLAFLGFALSNLTLVHFSVFEMGLLFALLTNKYYLHRHNKQILSINNLS
ncbi:O-antigen ligase family protein [Aureibaculum conchae]|uniref:O-antigen ligase family protein n=1 Tax=Aureibaculum sp. 2308TA14-22 TaxID=3108392 RepID=UPI0033990493